jgi:hypothetical protein
MVTYTQNDMEMHVADRCSGILPEEWLYMSAGLVATQVTVPRQFRAAYSNIKSLSTHISRSLYYLILQFSRLRLPVMS